MLLKEQIAGLIAEKTELTGKVEALTAQVQGLDATKSEMDKKIADALALIQTLTAENNTLISKLAGVEKELDEAKKALSSPAYNDANAGTKAVKGGDVQDDKADLVAQLNAIKDPAEKTAFFRKHFMKG